MTDFGGRRIRLPVVTFKIKHKNKRSVVFFDVSRNNFSKICQGFYSNLVLLFLF